MNKISKCCTCGYIYIAGKNGSHDCISQIKKKYEAEKKELLHACQMAHRKHSHNDDSIGWEELTDLLCDTLASVMGNDEYCKWLEGLGEI